MTILTAMTTNIINNGLTIGIALIAFLVLKEVSNADKNKNKKTHSFINVINIAIFPLFIVFMIVVADKAISVLSNF